MIYHVHMADWQEAHRSYGSACCKLSYSNGARKRKQEKRKQGDAGDVHDKTLQQGTGREAPVWLVGRSLLGPRSETLARTWVPQNNRRQHLHPPHERLTENLIVRKVLLRAFQRYNFRTIHPEAVAASITRPCRPKAGQIWEWPCKVPLIPPCASTITPKHP